MNRLDEFQKRASEVPPTDDIAIEGGKHVAIAVTESPEPKQMPEDKTLDMDHFFEQVKLVEGHIKKIETYTNEIERQHKTSIGSTNDDDKALCTQKLEQLVSGLSKASNESRHIIKDMDARTKELTPVASKGSGSLRIRLQKHRALVEKFTKVMKRFKKIQETYNDKYKDQLKRQIKIVNPQILDNELQKVLEDPEGARQMMFDVGKRKAAEKDLKQMKDRFDDVKKIGESIMELHQMFLEMDEMITQQGDVLNRIENSVNNVEDFTEDASKDLENAVESQKSILKKKWLMIVLVIVLIILIAWVLAYIVKSFGLTKIFKSSKTQPV